jgi:hypothetical protein
MGFPPKTGRAATVTHHSKRDAVRRAARLRFAAVLNVTMSTASFVVDHERRGQSRQRAPRPRCWVGKPAPSSALNLRVRSYMAAHLLPNWLRPHGVVSISTKRSKPVAIDLESLGLLPTTLCRTSFPHAISIMTGIAVASIPFLRTARRQISLGASSLMGRCLCRVSAPLCRVRPAVTPSPPTPDGIGGQRTDAEVKQRRKRRERPASH